MDKTAETQVELELNSAAFLRVMNYIDREKGILFEKCKNRRSNTGACRLGSSRCTVCE